MGETIVKKNAATALYGLLRAVRLSGDNTWERAWGTVLDAPVVEEDFVLRHAEVMSLLAQVVASVESMDEGEDRDMYWEYLGFWHSYVVPRTNWSAGINLEDQIDVKNLHMLASLGKEIDANRGRRGTSEGGIDSDNLESLLADLEAAVEGAGLSAEVVTQVISQINHIRWLISYQGFFGLDPIERETTSLIGRTFDLVAKATGDGKNRIAKAAAGLILAFSTVSVVMGHTASIVDSASSIATEIRVQVEKPKELEAAKTKELTASTSVDCKTDEDVAGETGSAIG